MSVKARGERAVFRVWARAYETVAYLRARRRYGGPLELHVAPAIDGRIPSTR